MTRRHDILELLSEQPRSVSSLARELGLRRGDAEDDLLHVIRSARAAGHAIEISPAVCRTCGFEFSPDRLSKPGRCPSCHGSRLLEAQVAIRPRG